MTLHENLATEPCVTTTDVGWIVNDEIPAGKPSAHLKTNIPYSFQLHSLGSYFNLQLIFSFHPLHPFSYLSISASFGGSGGAAECCSGGGGGVTSGLEQQANPAWTEFP